jgi:hypothetical protein
MGRGWFLMPIPMNQTGTKFSPFLSPYVQIKSSPSPSPNQKFYPLELFHEGYSDPWDDLFQPKDTLRQKRSPVHLLFTTSHRATLPGSSLGSTMADKTPCFPKATKLAKPHPLQKSLCQKLISSLFINLLPHHKNR